LADLGKGTFYKYFDSKETIIRVLLEEGLRELLGETEKAVAGASSDAKILSAVIDARVEFFLKYPDYLLLFHQVRGLMQLQVAAAKDLRDVYDAHLRRLARLMRPAVGGSESAKTRDLAIAVAAYTSGLLTYYLLFEGLNGIKRRRDSLIQTIEHSVRAMLRNGSESR
jgi:AcrR family transcriptional regulator